MFRISVERVDASAIGSTWALVEFYGAGDADRGAASVYRAPSQGTGTGTGTTGTMDILRDVT